MTSVSPPPPRRRKTVRQPIFNAPPVTMGMVVALVLIWGLGALLGIQEWMVLNFALQGEEFMALFSGADGGVGLHLALTAVTHMFLHYDLMHLFLNAGLLLAFGSMAERIVGGWRFLLLFLVSGLAGAWVQLLFGGRLDIVLFGASGAVYGALAGALWAMAPRLGLKRVGIYVLVILGLNVLIGGTDLALLLTGGEAEIAWLDHMGGFIAGGALFPWLALQRRRELLRRMGRPRP